MWLPLLDGVDRLGVMELVLPDGIDVDPAVFAERCELLAHPAGHMITARAPYGEGVTRLRHQRPRSVASELLRRLLPPLTFGCEDLVVSTLLEPAYEVSGDDLGAMNLYNRSPHAFSEESRQSGLPFAAHAAVALAQVQQREDLLTAVDSRDLIGQAKGILMERHKLTAEQAFHLLTTASQHRNVKLREIARELTSSGELKGPRGSL